jgi:hypothetical protein
MIIVRLMGGLGNQLFQYAAGRALAVARGTTLKLDTSAFRDYPLRSYRLDHFHISATVAGPEDMARVMGRRLWRPWRVLVRALEPRRAYYRRRIVHEPHYHYAPAIRKVGRDALLVGFWQSESYFAEIRGRLLEELSVTTPPDGANLRLLESIDGVDSISLHVRRGDYVTDPANRSFYAECGPDYYERAVQRLLPLTTQPHVFVFSDDPDWAGAHVRVPCPMTVVRHNGPDHDYEDLRLISRCRHHVTANSTFSWWGAWLGTHPGKRVIAPGRWFTDPTVNCDDVIPAGWERL